jgi:apolipoprotein D and lipocalin family protein
MIIVDIILAAFAIASSVSATTPLPVTAVDQVDLDRYCGTWYEIARLPNSFERKCDCNATAEYSKLSDGNLRVVNRCRKFDGNIASAQGIAREEDRNGLNAKFKVRFAPSWLGWIPFVWVSYWVIDLAPDYSYAVVGEPSRRYLWILSRTPNMSRTTCDAIFGRLKNMGYDTDKFVFSRHE